MKFAVYGSSGSGKSKLMEIVTGLAPNVTIHRKDTTRTPRAGEDEQTLDLRFVEEKEFSERQKEGEYDIAYYKYGGMYGVRRDQIVEAFQEKQVHYVIIRDINALKDFKMMYSDAKALYIHANPENIPRNLKARDGVKAEERMKRTVQEYYEYLDNSTAFDHVILNFWDIDNAIKQIRNIQNFYVRRAVEGL